MADLAATGHVAGPAVATFGQQVASVSQAATVAVTPTLVHGAAAADLAAGSAIRTCSLCGSRIGEFATPYWKAAAAGAAVVAAHASDAAAAASVAAAPYTAHIGGCLLAHVCIL